MRARMSIAMAVLAFSGMQAAPAHAGCGCDKPPPPLAAVRPAFASPGDIITLIAPSLQVGREYRVKFGVGEQSSTVRGLATRKRDFADGLYKPQLAVAVPPLPAGPTRIRVRGVGRALLEVPADDFTMLQRALVLREADAVTVVPDYRAAVGSDSTVYFPLDVSRIARHIAFEGVGEDFPLAFNAEDIAIYNTQGVLMQLLGPEQSGIFAITDPGSGDSFELIYDRHEFLTYRLLHAHVLGLGLDPADHAWHTDGTRHIDHDHLVIAIRGVVEGVGRPAPGATPPFTLRIVTALPDVPLTDIPGTILGGGRGTGGGPALPVLP